VLGNHVRGGAGQQPGAGRGRQRDLVDAVDGDVAHGPGGSGGGWRGLHGLLLLQASPCWGWSSFGSAAVAQPWPEAPSGPPLPALSERGALFALNAIHLL